MMAIHVARWSQAQQDQLRLCEEIEAVASRLPLHDIAALERLAAQLETLLDRVHTFEEKEVFPTLQAMSPHIGSLLATFREHHRRDRGNAGQLAAALARSPMQAPQDFRSLKSDLTAFAEMLRRHVQFEEAITMALFASKRSDEKRVVQ